MGATYNDNFTDFKLTRKPFDISCPDFTDYLSRNQKFCGNTITIRFYGIVIEEVFTSMSCTYP